MVVSPKAWVMVTDPPGPVAVGALPDEQAASTVNPVAAPARKNPRRLHCWSTA
jgi:hypothetical protein